MKCALYRIWNGEELIYVGISMSAYHRLHVHSRDKNWYYLATHITIQWFDTVQEAIQAETAAIQVEKPRFNILEVDPRRGGNHLLNRGRSFVEPVHDGKTKSETPEYKIWYRLLYKCNNSRAIEYAGFGGAGIKVDPTWSDFDIFIKDMGWAPGEKYSIIRIDDSADFTKENCRWVSTSSPEWAAHLRNMRGRAGRRPPPVMEECRLSFLAGSDSPQVLAETFGLNRSTVGKWVRRWRREGFRNVVRFSHDDQNYVAELSEPEADQLRAALVPYMEAGRRIVL